VGDAARDPARDARGRMSSASADPPAVPGERHLPGEEGIWVLILGDLLVFALFFATFLVYRGQDVALYAASQATMQRGLGLLNTGLLLTSSLFVALAVADARDRHSARALKLLAAALACGIGFVVSKAFEWGAKIGAGITLNTNEFYTFYYMFTGIHLLHLLIGLGVLGYLMLRTRRADPGPGHVRVMEAGAAFWHLVDLLWVVLFALLYLLR
jgi:nitric oxide reductase NorE protein